MCDFLLKRCGVNANTPGGAVSVIARPELVPSASTGQSHLYNGYLSPYNRMLDRAWLPLNGGAPVAQQSRSERRARKARLNVRAGGPGQPSTGAVSSCSSENGEDVPGGGSDDVSSASDSEAGASSRQPAAEAVAAAEGGAAFEDARGGGGLQPVEERGGQSGAEGRRGSRMREGRRSSGVFSDLALNSEVLMLLSPPLVPPTLLPLVHSPPAPAAAAGGSSLLADELAGTGGSPQPAAEDPMFSRVRSRSVDVRRASLTPLTAVVESGALAPAVASAARVGGASAGGASSSSNLPPASTASASAARSNGSDVAAAVAQLRKELAALSAAPDGGPGGSHASGGDAAASSAASRQDAVTLLRAEAAHALQREVGELREWLAAERERLQQDVQVGGDAASVPSARISSVHHFLNVARSMLYRLASPDQANPPPFPLQARQSSSTAPTAGSVVFGGRDGKSAARVPARSVEERQRAATITRDIADLCSRLQRASRSAAGKRPATLAANVRQPLLLTEEGRAFIANLPPALKTQSQLFATVPQPRCLLTRLV